MHQCFFYWSLLQSKIPNFCILVKEQSNLHVHLPIYGSRICQQIGRHSFFQLIWLWCLHRGTSTFQAFRKWWWTRNQTSTNRTLILGYSQGSKTFHSGPVCHSTTSCPVMWAGDPIFYGDGCNWKAKGDKCHLKNKVPLWWALTLNNYPFFTWIIFIKPQKQQLSKQ